MLFICSNIGKVALPNIAFEKNLKGSLEKMIHISPLYDNTH